MIRLGGYDCCVLDLFTDERGKLSNSKFWNMVGYTAITWAFVNHSLAFALDWELLTAYGAIVAGNHVAITFLKRRYPDVADHEPEAGRRGGRDADAELRPARPQRRMGRGPARGRTGGAGGALHGAVRGGPETDAGGVE